MLISYVVMVHVLGKHTENNLKHFYESWNAHNYPSGAHFSFSAAHVPHLTFGGRDVIESVIN